MRAAARGASRRAVLAYVSLVSVELSPLDGEVLEKNPGSRELYEDVLGHPHGEAANRHGATSAVRITGDSGVLEAALDNRGTS